MKLPPEIQFHEDICLLVYRPRGLVNKAAVNKIISVIGELEITLKEPFNRFSDTVAADAVDLNFECIIHVSLYRRRFYGKRPPIKSAILAQWLNVPIERLTAEASGRRPPGVKAANPT